MDPLENVELEQVKTPLQNIFGRRPQNEFVYIPSENIRERPFDQFSDNTSMPGFSYLTVSPSAVLRDIIPTPFASPFLMKGCRLADIRQTNEAQTRHASNDPFINSKRESSGRLVDFFLPRSNEREQTTNLNRPPSTVARWATRIKKTSQPEHRITKSRSPSLSECDDNSDDQNYFDKKKLTKGLKLLSVIVRDIVNEKQSTTYKEVAEVILRDTINLEQLNLTNKSMIAKEEQNIKRRVYDALNVLISAGVLVKEGKRVRKNDNMQKVKINMKRTEMNSMQSRIVG